MNGTLTVGRILPQKDEYKILTGSEKGKVLNDVEFWTSAASKAELVGLKRFVIEAAVECNGQKAKVTFILGMRAGTLRVTSSDPAVASSRAVVHGLRYLTSPHGLEPEWRQHGGLFAVTPSDDGVGEYWCSDPMRLVEILHNIRDGGPVRIALR